MNGTNTDFLRQLIATFHLEADEHLKAMINGLLALEKAGTADEQTLQVEIIFREAHSLKGAARAVDLTEVEAVCQALEGVFARLKRREMSLAPEDFDTIHRALDTATSLLAEPDQPHATRVAEAIQGLAQLETTNHQRPSPPEKAEAAGHPRMEVGEYTSSSPPFTEDTSSRTVPSSLVSPAASSIDDSSDTAAPVNKTFPHNDYHPILQDYTSPPVDPSPASDFLGKLIATFRLEADEHLKAMVTGLLDLEKRSREEQGPLLEIIFREAHSLKGAARAVNLTDIEAVCQALEGIFARLKRREFQLSVNGFDAVHHALDTIEKLLSEPHLSHATRVTEAAQRLARIDSEEITRAAPPSAPQASSTSIENPPLATVSPWRGSDSPPEVKAPPLTSSVFVTAHSRRGGIEQKSNSSGHDGSQGELPTTQAKAGVEDTIRVTTAKLDSLFLQAEEMLSAKLSVNQHALDLKEMMSLLGEWRKEWAKISAEVRKVQRLIETNESWEQQGAAYQQAAPQLVEFLYWNEQQFVSVETRLKGLIKAAEHDQQTVSALVDTLLENTKRVLMMPCSSLLEIFPKMVRDLSRSLGKEVELITRGSDVEIDKRILEELKTPLIHLLRNSVDHGIEPPEVRARYEKPPRGTIVITVSQTSGSSVEILVSDDGGGIDREKVVQAAIKKGYLSPQARDTLDEQAALALIFQSEISTSLMVTDISGRGLGMAIVREKIEKLSGQISVETHLHEGTSFRIVVPLTLATFRGVFVETAGRTFVVPTISIERVVRIKQSEIKTIDGKDAIFLDARPIAFVSLDTVLQLPRKSMKRTNADIRLILVLSAADKKIACGVDEVDNEQEVLFKGLGAFLSQVPNVAGATVLGSGKVVPILHVPDLLKSASSADETDTSTPTTDREREVQNRSVLVAEDSVTSRMMLKGILESAGYLVTTAVDGADAFTLLQKKAFDLVVSDVEMPRMNGFDLTTKIRSTEQIAQIPVVLVTGLDSREDRERGITAGADAYIVKTSFDQSNLLDVVQQLI